MCRGSRGWRSGEQRGRRVDELFVWEAAVCGPSTGHQHPIPPNQPQPVGNANGQSVCRLAVNSAQAPIMGASGRSTALPRRRSGSRDAWLPALNKFWLFGRCTLLQRLQGTRGSGTWQVRDGQAGSGALAHALMPVGLPPNRQICSLALGGDVMLVDRNSRVIRDNSGKTLWVVTGSRQVWLRQDEGII